MEVSSSSGNESLIQWRSISRTGRYGSSSPKNRPVERPQLHFMMPHGRPLILQKCYFNTMFAMLLLLGVKHFDLLFQVWWHHARWMEPALVTYWLSTWTSEFFRFCLAACRPIQAVEKFSLLHSHGKLISESLEVCCPLWQNCFGPTLMATSEIHHCKVIETTTDVYQTQWGLKFECNRCNLHDIYFHLDCGRARRQIQAER